ncbi:MAG: hypothetical protein AAF679_09810, partial [Pseudomonadota bacterium]
MSVMSFGRAAAMAGLAALTLAACSDSSTELASPGEVAPNPGTQPPPAGGGGGGGTPPPSNGTCPDGTTLNTVGGSATCQITAGAITSNLTLTQGNVYSLQGSVTVGVDVGSDGSAADGNSVTLTIEPGVTIFGETLQSLLIIARGSRIVANGTAADPIVFTSAQDVNLAAQFGQTQRAVFTGAASDDPNSNEWSGLIINGRAPLNVATGEAEGEGDSGFYGGDQPTDDSGSLRYIQVKYAGNPITGTDELNSIALQGVGSNTVVDFVQIHNGAD